MELIACGLSFHSAPLAVREQVAVPDESARTTLRFLVGHSGLREAAVLSTCNRTEFYLTAPDPALVSGVGERLARYLDPAGRHGIAEHLVTRTGDEAVRHIFRVAGGLDSMVVGEAQILGQLKHAHRLARDAGTIDHTLDFVLARAVSIGKRVRTETGIGRGTASVAELAVAWARESLGGLEGRGVLLVGAGEVAAAVARRLGALGARLVITSRGGVSARALAAELGGVAVETDRIDEVIAGIDIVVTSTDSPVPVLSRADAERLQERRGHRALAVLDIAVPRDVDPTAAAVPGVVLTDLDALGAAMEENLAGRRRLLPEAEAIVAAAVPETVALLRERSAAAPTIRRLVERAEEVRRAELERGLGDVDEATRERMETLTRSLVRKLLHAPISHLREHAEDPGVALNLRAAFDLDDLDERPAPRRRR